MYVFHELNMFLSKCQNVHARYLKPAGQLSCTYGSEWPSVNLKIQPILRKGYGLLWPYFKMETRSIKYVTVYKSTVVFFL